MLLAHNRKRKNLRLACAAVLAPLLPLAATAQDAERARERASIVFGAFITDRQSTTRLDSAQGRGTDVKLENDLGLDASETVARVGGNFWFKPRQRIDLSLFDLSRNATNQIDETIRFRDQTYAVDTVVQSDSDLTILKASYTFSPLVSEDGFFGVSGGLYTAFTQLSIANVMGGELESEDLTAPLPVIGFRGAYAVTDAITFRAAAEWFRFASGDLDGRLRDVYMAVDYAVSDRWSIGVAFNEVSMRLEARETGGFEGALDWGYDGALLYLKVNF